MDVLASVQKHVHVFSGGLFANWMPADKVDVGDYGIVSGERFVRDGNLSELDIPVEVDVPSKSKGKLEYTDRAEVSTSIGLKVAAAIPGLPPPKTSARIKFSGKGAFIYHLSGITTRRFKDTRKLYEEIARRWLAGDLHFEERSVIVSETRAADKATIVVSQGHSAVLELSGDFELAGEAILAEAKGQLSVATKTGSMFRWLASDATTPLIGLIRPEMGPPDGGDQNRAAGVVASFVQKIQDLFSQHKWDVRTIQMRDYVQAQEHASFSAILPDGQIVLFQFRKVKEVEFFALNDPSGGQAIVKERVQTVAISRNAPGKAA